MFRHDLKQSQGRWLEWFTVIQTSLEGGVKKSFGGQYQFYTQTSQGSSSPLNVKWN